VVLLIVMWVRGYWVRESFSTEIGNINSVRGAIIVNYFDLMYAIKHGHGEWFVTRDAPERWSDDGPMPRWPPIRIDPSRIGVLSIELEYWFLTPLFVLLSTAVWHSKLGFRFSLRTLLIATTLIAVVLGLIVVVVRWPAS
jgi:hypothetical protein